MILLDTNVLSALMHREPPRAVIAWLDGQTPESLWISSVTLFEARYGIAVLAEGRRKDALRQALDALVGEDLQHRVAAFDSGAAKHAARLASNRKRAGRPVDLRDTFIAGVALSHGATLATRNTRHFEDLPAVIDPWTAAG